MESTEQSLAQVNGKLTEAAFIIITLIIITLLSVASSPSLEAPGNRNCLCLDIPPTHAMVGDRYGS